MEHVFARVGLLRDFLRFDPLRDARHYECQVRLHGLRPREFVEFV